MWTSSGVARVRRGNQVFALRPICNARLDLFIIALMLFVSVHGNKGFPQEDIPKPPAGRSLGETVKQGAELENSSQTRLGQTSTDKQVPKEVNQFPISNEEVSEMGDSGHSGSRRPSFLIQPQDHYVYKHSPARLTCSVESAREVVVKCNDRKPSPSMVEVHEEKNSKDASTITLMVTVTRNEVEALFSQHKYWCQCIAYNKDGMTKSRKALVETAYLRKNFEQEPVGGEVVLGNEYKLHCRPPAGEPAPSIEWLWNDVAIDPMVEENIFITQDGDLIIRTTSVEDSGNYSCVARNGASKRKSHPATLRVIVNGGWGSWSSWSGCGSKCGIGEERRLRTCTHPQPQNGGASCQGVGIQTRACTKLCPVDGGWTDWSRWSACSPECVHRRRRTCSRPEPYNNGMTCPGSDIETKNCSGGLCAETRNLTTPTDNQNLVLYSCLFVALALLLMIVIATMIVFRRKRGGSTFSRSPSSGYGPGRTSTAYPNSPMNGHMGADDFCIIPTKLPSVMKGDPLPPFSYPPAYSALDQAYKMCNHPGSQSASDTSSSPPTEPRFILHNEHTWRSGDVRYHGNYARASPCSRDDVTIPQREFPDLTSSFVGRTYHEKPTAPPSVDSTTHESPASGRPCDASPHKRVTFGMQQGYDSGFEGETNPNYAPKRPVRKTEPLAEFQEEWRDSSDSSDAGYSCSHHVTSDTHQQFSADTSLRKLNQDNIVASART